ncbi:hypothetical protein EV702DRAFT_1138155 [Suillus placidus]|uniref:Methyltransferase domain-containing protein n=1 Tax=Suillus placidus TaxID=48579 RepID=A0A9P6ZLL7_9AGAM|nr:hypothetical protein EV702DRAFT_1138155 [Suillus placidus]
MYPVPGGLSPWSAPSYPSRSLPTPPSPPQSNFILRGPVGVRSAPGTLLPIPKAEDHSTPSDPALALNVHGGIDTSSRLHHRFRRQQVPYPRSYQRKVIDLDAIDTLLTRQMSGGSLTWHAFPQSWNEQPAQEPLKRILDVGCGDGVWVIEAAKYWKGCQVVGLDIVSLHPDLARLSRDKDLLKRISWVQANLYVHTPSPYPALISHSLEGLPFPNESFDFVHVKRIARGVPENMWDDLFEEISRVMKPGAAFEVVEEDLSFPGRSDGEGSEVGTLRSNISMSTYSLSLGTESGRCSAVGSMSSSSDFTRAVTTPDSVPSITINARSYRSIADNSPISVPDSPPVASNNTHPQPFIHRSLSSRQPPSPIRSNETLTLARPSTATTPSPSSPSHPFHSSSSSQSTFLSFSSNGSTPTPSMMSTSPRPPPSHKFNKAAQAVLMEPTLTPFFAGVGPITSSGSGSSSASLFSSSAVSGVALSTSPSSGNGVGASSTSSSGSPPVPQKKNKAAQAVLMEPTATPFFVLPQNKSRVSLMGESSSSGSGSSGSVRENGKGWSRGSFGGRVSVGLGLNLGFKSGTSPSLGSPGPGSPGTSSSSRMVEDELGDGLGTGGLESRFPVGTPPDSQLGAALGPSLLDSRGVVSPDSRGVIPPDPRDHTVLETIYNEMHAERFINLAPLSLLANTVGLWFKGESLSFIWVGGGCGGHHRGCMCGMKQHSRG